MSAFNANVQTATQASAAANDSKPPALGSLGAGSMTSPAALAGTTGVDVRLIHGDCWDQIVGNYVVNILKNEATTITLNETRTVNGNLVNKVVGTTTDTRIGVHNQTNIAPRNDTYFHTRTEDHHQPEQIHQPTSQVNSQNTVAEYFKEHTKFSSWYFSMVGIKMDLTPIVSLGFATLEGKLGVLATKALLLEKQSKALDAKYQAATTKFTLTAVLASMLWAKVIMFDGNAGVAANADSPFA